MKILILGASGHIGSLIYKYYKNLNYDVIGTYFKNKNKDLIKFDISEDSKLSDYLIGGMDLIIWAIGFKDILKTENFEGNTYKINVVLMNLFLLIGICSVILYLLLNFFAKASSKKIAKGIRYIIFTIGILLAIALFIVGRYAFSIPILIFLLPLKTLLCVLFLLLSSYIVLVMFSWL